MSTTVITFTANAADIVIDGRTVGRPGSRADLLTQDPVAATVWDEFDANGTTSGTVTITAV